MSDSELHAKLTTLIRWFKSMGVSAQQKAPDFRPRCDLPCNENLRHVHWLVVQALAALMDSRRLDAERYYGFLTGILWWTGLGPDQDGVQSHEQPAANRRAEDQGAPRANLSAHPEVPAIPS